MAAPRLQPFDGKAEHWPSFKAKLTAYADMNIPNVDAVLTGKLDDSASTSAQNAYHAASRKLHNAIVLSLDGMPLAIVSSIAGRDGRAAWECLLAKYEQHSTARSVQLLHDLDSMCLHAGDDPDMLFSKIEHTQRQLQNMNVQYSDEQAVAFILRKGVLPEDVYAPLVPVMLSAENITFSNVKSLVRSFYVRADASRSTVHDGVEHALTVSSNASARQARRCNHCKRLGHVAANCRLKQGASDTANNNAVVCHRCGGRGHVKRQCPSPAALEGEAARPFAQSNAAFTF